MTDAAGFYKNKKVFVTGHTGFKGTWLCSVLLYLGAEVTGYALPADNSSSLFGICRPDRYMRSIEGDIRDGERLKKCCSEAKPDIVIHLAAQPIVRESYRRPAYTYGVNMMGTVNILEAVMCSRDTVGSFLNVTTDKVYSPAEKDYFSEKDVLDGYDPYSNSKSCSELITACYRRCYGDAHSVAVSTARAGNVIGGGDFAADRIIPDCVRAALEKKDIIVRNPNSERPYQYVLDALFAYLTIAAEQYGDTSKSGCYNVGPVKQGSVSTGKLVDMFCGEWGNIKRVHHPDAGDMKEIDVVRLDCSLIRRVFGCMPETPIEETVRKICGWTKAWMDDRDMFLYNEDEVRGYFASIKDKCI